MLSQIFFADTPGESEELDEDAKAQGSEARPFVHNKRVHRTRRPTWIDGLIEEKISGQDASQG